MFNRIYVSCGDLNGIGIEVLEKAIQPYLSETQFILSIPSSFSTLFSASKILTNNELPIQSGLYILPLYTKTDFVRQAGKYNEAAGIIAHDSFVSCMKLIKNDLSSGLLTLPIHKKSFQSAGSSFAGHTEYIGQLLDEPSPLMILMNSKMKVALLTTHLPVSKVASAITTELIEKMTKQFHHSLITDFNIQKPKIALLGLNPHAGDDGVIGDEEIRTYLPAIRNLNNDNIVVEGPFSSDGFFGAGLFSNYDGILASYHDQGLIPLKLSDMKHGVNFSAGSSIVRTSPDHGTAYDIAGQGTASHHSVLEAIRWNIMIRKNRKLI